MGKRSGRWNLERFAEKEARESRQERHGASETPRQASVKQDPEASRPEKRRRTFHSTASLLTVNTYLVMHRICCVRFAGGANACVNKGSKQTGNLTL